MTNPPGIECTQPDCEGGIIEDGYCNNCGLPPNTGYSAVRPSAGTAATTGGSGRRVTGRVEIERLLTPVRSMSTGKRSNVGAGVVYVRPADEVDPTRLVLRDPKVPEDHRYCSNWNCEEPVGRERPDGRPGLETGFCPSCGTPFDFATHLRTGDLVQDQYQVKGALAHGGMGWIYLAEDHNVSDRPCVLKGLINPRDPDQLQAAETERRFLAESSHPNIVDIYNFASHRRGDDERGYIVMQYVGGRSLKQIAQEHRRRTGTPLPVTEAIAYILAVLPAFGYLHRRHRVYCDFKPDNAIHTADGVKLIDLGAVRRLDDDISPIFGTPGYQAPEVPETGPTVVGDLYTIGRTLAVLILDWPDWQYDDHDRLPDRDDHPILHRHDCLWRFLRRACAPDPGDRFADADEMAGALRGVLCQVAADLDGIPRPFDSSRWAPPLPFLTPFSWDTLPRPILPPHPHLQDQVAGIAEGETAIRVVERVGRDLSWADLAVAALAYCRRDPTRAGELVEQIDPTHADAAGVAPLLDAARHYLRGVVAWARKDIERAQSCFDAAYSSAPGEPACALAAAAALETSGTETGDVHRLEQASALYFQVAITDRSWVAATAGIARAHRELHRQDEARQPTGRPDDNGPQKDEARQPTGPPDDDGPQSDEDDEPTGRPEDDDLRRSHLDQAARALMAVPRTHPLLPDALAEACRYVREGAHFGERIAAAAGNHLAPTRPRNRSTSDANLAVELCRAALAARDRSPDGELGEQIYAAVGQAVSDPADDPDPRPDLARAAELALLELADATPDRAHRHALLDEAAYTRPWTLL